MINVKPRTGDPTKVRCERDGTTFVTCLIRESEQGRRWIDCPTCGRGYYQQPDGSWESDRKLTVLEVAR